MGSLILHFCLVIYVNNNNSQQHILIGGLEHFLVFQILGTIIPTNFHIFQRGWIETTNQILIVDNQRLTMQ